eukprot:COSAG02_NODE_2441_length_8858_cov_31.570271_4_plen_55_part_00
MRSHRPLVDKNSQRLVCYPHAQAMHTHTTQYVRHLAVAVSPHEGRPASQSYMIM